MRAFYIFRSKRLSAPSGYCREACQQSPIAKVAALSLELRHLTHLTLDPGPSRSSAAI